MSLVGDRNPFQTTPPRSAGAAGPSAPEGPGVDTTDRFTPSQGPLMLAQAAGPRPGNAADTVIDTVGRVPGGNPSMPYFPGGYNPTSPSGPADLLNRVATPAARRLDAALNPQARQETAMALHLVEHGRRNHGNAYSMPRAEAFSALRRQYPGVSDQQLNGFLDRLADQVHNAGILGSLFGSGERAHIYADDLAAFLQNRPR